MTTISIEELKPLGTKVTSELNRDKEPVEEFKQVVKYAEQVLSGVPFKDQKASDYFYDEFLGCISKAALKTYRFRNTDLIQMILRLCQIMTLLFSKVIDKDPVEFVARMRYVLDPEMTFYREYCLKSSETFQLQVLPEEPPGWREALKKDDHIDVLKKEDDKLRGWTTGVITDRQKDLIWVQYEGEPDVDSFLLTTATHEIAPYGSYTAQNEWRKKLAKNDIIDCLDAQGKWYTATILDIEYPPAAEQKKPVRILVGYRTYCENGPKKDAEGKIFMGWSNTYDEWIKLYSLRIQKRGSLAKQGYILCKKSEDEDDKEAIDDNGDILINAPINKETYCVLRPDKLSCESVVRLLNIFGNEGGFDKMLARLNDKEKPLSFELAYFYLDIIGIVWKHLHRKFANKYIPKFQQAIINYFQNAADIEIRKVQKERFDKILKNLENLLRRVYSVIERFKIMELFELSMCTILLKSNYLQRRIDGLKGFNAIAKNIFKGMTRTLNAEFLTKWITKNEIMDELLGPKTHPQILQRSAHTITLMFERNLLEQKTLEALWSNTKDDQFAPEVFKVIKEVGFPAGSKELDFFMQKISEMPPDQVTEDALDVIYESQKAAEKIPELLLRYANFMTNIAFEEKYPLAISEKALAKFSGMISGLTFEPYKKNMLEKYVKEMLAKNMNPVMTLKLIKRIISQYNSVSIGGITHTKGLITDILIKEFDILKILFDVFFNFLTYYKQAKETRQKIIEKHTHAENINERVDFLNFMMTTANNPPKFTLPQLYLLWEILCENPITKEDSQVLYKFLKDIIPDHISYVRYMDPAEGKKFFEEKICNPKNSFENLTTESFNCIIQFFTLVNENEGLVQVNRSNRSKYSSYTSYSNVSGAVYGEYSFTKKDDDNMPELRTKVHPQKLHGSEIFWKIVQEVVSKDVIEKARDFLNKLYTMLSGELEGKASEIRGSFIETYLEKLSALTKESHGNETPMITKMINLMMDMIDESERKGTGNIKSHSALLKGPMLSFNVINNATTSKNVPKKMDIEAYSNTTIWQLKKELGKYIESSPECIKISIGTKELKDTDNGKTIGELMQKRSSTLTLDKKNMDDIPKAPLVTEDNKLTPKAKVAFTEIFNKFAKDGKMNNEGAAQFIQNTTGEPSVAACDTRVKMLFANFDTDKDGFLDADGFCEFYRDAIVTKREDTVRQNLAVHGFRNDLKRMNEVEEVIIDISTLPRYILSCNPKSFDLLFKILDMGESNSGEQTWNLISRLTTNEMMYRQLLSLNAKKDDKGNTIWNELIDVHSTYRLLYSLQIMESFLEEKDPNKDTLDDPLKKAWQKQFIELGGFDYLLSIFMNTDSKKGLCFIMSDHIGKFEKECLGYLGNILNSFIRNATYSLNEKIQQDVANMHQFIKRKVEAEDVEITVEEKPAITDAAVAARVGRAGTATKDEGKAKEKAKEPQIDLKELFKAKPSSIIFLKSALEPESKEPEKSKLTPMSPIDQTTSKRIISSVNTKEFWTRQLDILATILSSENISFYDNTMATAALHLFSSCVLINNDVFVQAQNFNKNSTFDQLITKGMLCEKSQAIREEFADSFYFLSCVLKNSETKALEYSLKVLLKNMPKSKKEGATDCGEYFKLLGKLIDMYYDTKLSGEPIFDPKLLLKDLVEMLKNHKTVEKRNTIGEDKLLIGIMHTIRKILSHEPSLKEFVGIEQGLLQEVFFNCLFPTLTTSTELPTLSKTESSEGSTDAQKCKTKESRTAAYKLLSTLCGGNLPSQSYLIRNCLEPLCKSIKQHAGWSYIPFSESRSKLGYAGIENLGCICYMIAMIQQFYMIPTLRYALMAADDKKAPIINKPGEPDDNVLHQFQRIFGFLELTERQDYNPGKFCFAFKDQDKRPTNISLQQDAQEFLNLLFDRLENHLKDTPEKYLLQSVFGGKTCSQILCKGGCGSVRKNYEDFYNLSVGVKGNKTLFESLGKFISGDTLSDVECEACGKKTEAVKRTVIANLPNVLIIHLQRLLFNFDLERNEKINSRLEFPKEFSIEPYTVEGVEAREKAASAENKEKSNTKEEFNHGHEPGYYEYKLAGVLVHYGVAEAGHYYSYINANRKINIIKSITKLEQECFGGSNENQKESSGFSFRFFDHSNIKNAYMLVYERKLKTPLKKIASPQDIEKLSASNQKALECENTALARVGQIYFDQKKNEYLTYNNFNDVIPRVPHNLYQEVWEDNSTFLFERQIYSNEFFQFVHDIFKESYSLLPALPKPNSDDTAVSMTRIASKIIYDVLAHAYYNTNIKDITEQLITLFKQSEAATNEFTKYILQDELRESIYLITKCPDKSVRIAIGNLITEAVALGITREGEKCLNYEIEMREHMQIFKFGSDIGRVMHHLLININNDLSSNWPRFEQFFNILFNVTIKGGDAVAIFLNKRRVIAYLIDFYLGTDSPLYEKGEKRVSMGNKFKNPKFGSLINLVCRLSLHSDLSPLQKLFVKLKEIKKLPKTLYEIDEEEKKCILCKEFINKTITEGHATAEFAELLSVLCYENKEYSKMLARMLIKAVNEDPNIDMISYFAVLKGVLTIEDTLQEKRLEWLFGIPQPLKGIAQLSANSKPHEQFKYGLSLVDSVKDDIFEYISPLNYNNRYESLLALLWKHRKTFEIQPIKCLLDLMCSSTRIFNYVTSLPSPSYQYAKYTDWIKPIVVAYPTSTRTIMGYSFYTHSEKNNIVYQETLKLMTQFDKLWNDYIEKMPKYTDQNGILLAYPQPYLIGKSLDEKILSESKGEANLTVSEVITEVYQSLPNGKENIGVPEGFIEKPKMSLIDSYVAKIKAENESKKEEEKKAEKSTSEEKEIKKEEKVEIQVKPPWKIEATILKFEVLNSIFLLYLPKIDNTKTVKIKINLLPKKPEGNKVLQPINFAMPKSPISIILEGQKRAILFLFTRQDLSKPWGDFDINVKVKLLDTKAHKKVNDLGSVDVETNHFYGSDEDDDPYGKEYISIGGTQCKSCKHVNNLMAEKCARCGEPLDDDFYY